MAKKLFIGMKPGLFRDPKHHHKMGESVWLYAYLVDRANWDTGVVGGFKDEECAEEMEMSLSWVRKWRRHLESEQYIAVAQCGSKGQQIQITKWVNPRLWKSAQAAKGDTNVPPSNEDAAKGDTESDTNETLLAGDTAESDTQSDTNVSPLPGMAAKGDTESGTQSDTPSVTNATPPTLYSHDHMITDSKDNQALHKHPAVQAYREAARRYPPKAWYQDIADTVGEEADSVARWQAHVKDWIGRGWNPGNVKGMLETFLIGQTSKGGQPRKPSNGSGSHEGSRPGTIPRGMEKENRTDIRDATPEFTQTVIDAVLAGRKGQQPQGEIEDEPDKDAA